jgi:hypothetical protein
MKKGVVITISRPSDVASRDVGSDDVEKIPEVTRLNRGRVQ